MQASEAKNLKIGDFVEYRTDTPSEDDGGIGVVIELGEHQFRVKWAEGSCRYSYIHAARIHRARVERSN